MSIFMKKDMKHFFTEPAEGLKCLHLPSSPLFFFFFKKPHTTANFTQSHEEPVFKSLDLSQQQNGLLSRNQFPREAQHGNGDVTAHVT